MSRNESQQGGTTKTVVLDAHKEVPLRPEGSALGAGHGNSVYPDFLLTTYSRGLVPDQPSDQLAQRVKATEGFPEIHVFRNRDATLGGMKAHEWLARRTDSNHEDIALLKFVAESMRPDPALMRPYLNINLNTGGQLTRGPEAGTYVSSSLTPKEAMGLWDAMIPSIRLRPDAMRLKGNGNWTSP